MLRYRVAVRFAIDGDVRFLSHNDSIRLFGRALARAGLPVRYTQGFNPLPRIWLLAARPVGVVGDEELLIIELSEDVSAQDVRDRLGAQLPAGVALKRVQPVAPDVLPRVAEISYQLAIPPELAVDVCEAVEQLAGSESCPVLRPRAGKHPAKTVDIRPALSAIRYHDGVLEFAVRQVEGPGVRPADVLLALKLSAALLADVHRRMVWHRRLD